MRLGIVSDTHISSPKQHLPKVMLDGLAGVDLIIHAGDIQRMFVLDQLREIADVFTRK